MKKLCVLLVVAVMLVCMAGCGEPNIHDQGSGNVGGTVATTVSKQNVGKYSVTIDGCRLAKDYEGKDVAIVKYTFTNVSDDEPASFMWSMSDKVFQGGISLEHAYFVDEDAGYDSGNQTREIKKGASIQLEVAYELTDTTSDVEVEVSELLSWDGKVVKRTFHF